jgi:hypothetical protein
MGSINGSTRRRAVLAGAGVIGVVFLVWLFIWWWSRPPQMGREEEVTKTVDALFTAVTARDEKLLGQCEQRLHAYGDAGKLPADASTYLDGIITMAREGRWEAAAERLYNFVKAQRREGSHDHQPAKRKDKGGSKTGQK